MPDTGKTLAIEDGDPKRRREAEIKSKIGEHLRMHGSKNWNLLREDPAYSDLIGKAAGNSAERKFRRWVEQVKAGPKADRTKPHQSNDAAKEHYAWAEATAEEKARVSGILMPPAYFAKKGVDGALRIDLMACLKQSFEDIALLRRSALAVDPSNPAEVIVKDARVLDLAIRRTFDAVAWTRDLYSDADQIDKNEEFTHEAIKVIVNEMEPLKCRATLERLRDFNNLRFTAKVPGGPPDGGASPH